MLSFAILPLFSNDSVCANIFWEKNFLIGRSDSSVGKCANARWIERLSILHWIERTHANTSLISSKRNTEALIHISLHKHQIYFNFHCWLLSKFSTQTTPFFLTRTFAEFYVVHFWTAKQIIYKWQPTKNCTKTAFSLTTNSSFWLN